MTKEQLLHLADQLKKKQLSKEDISLVEQLFFFEESLPSTVDFVVVLAGKKLNRIEKGIEVVKEVGGILLLSGGNFDEGEWEWEKYVSYAVSHGIEREKILVEKTSTNTYENLKNSLAMLPKSPLSVVFVSSRFHLLRVRLTLKKILQEENWIHPFFVSSSSRGISWEHWILFSRARLAFAKELEKIVRYHLESYLS